MRFIAKESSAAETIGKQWMADKCGYRDGVRNMNTDVGAELRSRLRARSGSATGCHRQVIHYRPPCGARNFLLAAASQYFDRCTFHALPSSAAGGGRLSERYLHQFRLAASDVSARCRLAVPEISCSLPLREISTAARFTPCLLPPPAADVCQTVIYINFVLRHPRYRLAAALRCPKFLARCRFAKFRPLHVSRPAFFRRRRRQGVKPLSNQNKRALLRSARRIGIRSRLRARSGSATGVHRTVIHYRPPCGARNFFARCRSRNFDRCTFHALPSSATGGGKAQNPVRITFISKEKSTSAKCFSLLAAE